MAVLFVMNPTLPAQVKVDPGIGVTMLALANEVLQSAQDLAPVQTGALKASLRVELAEGNAGRVSVNVDYWLFPEFGTSKMDAEPYLRPALTASGANLT